MRSEELMQNDWVKLSKVDIFCKVRSVLIDGHIVGETSSGGHFEQKAADLAPVELTQDIILRTSFWMKNRNLFKKTVAGIAAFSYMKDVNNHHITCLHELQQLYRHYAKQELEVDLSRNKRKEYGQRYNKRKKESDGEGKE